MIKRTCLFIAALSLALGVVTVSPPLGSKAIAQAQGSCEPPMILQDGQCVPETWVTDIVVVGTRFDALYFNTYMIPAYYPGQISHFNRLPRQDMAISRARELLRRKRIHDCIAGKLADGFRQNGQWVVREVTFEHDGARARFDIVYGNIPGVPMGVVEVKTVLDYENWRDDLLVRNQPKVANAIVSGYAIPVGSNASAAGFFVGMPIGRTIPVAVQPFLIDPSCE
ncbi:hypothetical protein E5A73_02465 [Sphingomonas gei]|uniref:Uncharacterized protein n=1 Tax=Sphingomonas gei TaxID=1395960 RepID=A0A4S1XIR8_9SPHN|nr:hypothetical protein [Sphingomonas gei]TGX55995.1 hypothetical protein E5A73_02465 [Sphingomonas gei]